MKERRRFQIHLFTVTLLLLARSLSATEPVYPPPAPEKPIVGQTMVGVSVGALFVVMVFMLIRARRKRTRLQFSMGLMLLAMFVASIGMVTATI